jgi:hypothetical protein
MLPYEICKSNERIEATSDAATHAHWLAPEMRAVLIERCPMQDISFEGIVDFFEKLNHQAAKNELWRNAVGKQLVQMATNLQENIWRLLGAYGTSDVLDERFPIGGIDDRIKRQNGCGVLHTETL